MEGKECPKYPNYGLINPAVFCNGNKCETCQREIRVGVPPLTVVTQEQNFLDQDRQNDKPSDTPLQEDVIDKETTASGGPDYPTGFFTLASTDLLKSNPPVSSPRKEEEPKSSNLPPWITGRQLVSFWEKEDFELFDFMRKGLQAYTKYGKRIIDSDTLELEPRQPLDWFIALIRGSEGTRRVLGGLKLPSTETEIIDRAKLAFDSQIPKIKKPPEDCKLISFTIPNDEIMAAKVISEAMSFRFKKEDVFKFGKEHKLHPLTEDNKTIRKEAEYSKSQPVAVEEKTSHKVEVKIIEENIPDLSRHDYAFCRIGKNWFIKFNGKLSTLPDLERIRYIVHLLNRPDESIYVVDLYTTVKRIFMEYHKEDLNKDKNNAEESDEWEQDVAEKSVKWEQNISNFELEGLSYEERENLIVKGYELLNKI